MLETSPHTSSPTPRPLTIQQVLIERGLKAIEGKWIAIEGVDAVGKTTQLEKLKGLCLAHGKQAVCLTEFSSSPLGDLIQKIIANRRFFALHQERLTPYADTYSILSDLTYSLETIPKSSQATVLSDRGVLSLLAYQAERISRYGGTSLTQAVEHVADVALIALRPFRLPDLSIVLTLSSEEIQRRVAKRGEAPLSDEDLRMLESMHRIFLALGTRFPLCVLQIEGLDTEGVTEQILKMLQLKYSQPN